MQAKTKELKNSLNQEFRLIHELCLFVLNASQKPDLIRATLSTLHAFLSWVPLAYIFNSNLVEVLLKLFPEQPFRNVALQCLTEVGLRCHAVLLMCAACITASSDGGSLNLMPECCLLETATVECICVAGSCVAQGPRHFLRCELEVTSV